MNLMRFALLVCAFNAVALGNGPAMIPLFRRSLVEEHGVLSTDQLLYAFAISQVTPGQANLFVPSIGYTLFGVVGAVVAIVVMVLPAYTMLPLIRGYERLRERAAIRNFTRGLVSTSVGLIAAATIQMGCQALTQPVAWVCFLLTAALTYYWRWHPLLSLATASAVGAGWILSAG
jgi:chromate transporter